MLFSSNYLFCKTYTLNLHKRPINVVLLKTKNRGNFWRMSRWLIIIHFYQLHPSFDYNLGFILVHFRRDFSERNIPCTELQGRKLNHILLVYSWFMTLFTKSDHCRTMQSWVIAMLVKWSGFGLAECPHPWPPVQKFHLSCSKYT